MLAFTAIFYRAATATHSRTTASYNYLGVLIVAIAALTYLAMAVEVHGPVLRFADWAPSTALLVVDLGFLAGAGGA